MNSDDYYRERMTADRYVPENGAPDPVSHRPGSPEKIAELCRRAEAGHELWAQDDMTVFAPMSERSLSWHLFRMGDVGRERFDDEENFSE